MRTTLENGSPSLAAAERFASAQHVKFQRLLVPVDFTPATLQALRFAGVLAERFGSTVYLLHVIEDQPVAAMGEAVVIATRLDAELTQETGEQLSRLASEELPASLSVKPLVRRGNAAREILNAAETLNADLVVLATHGRSAFGRLLWGSTAPHVQRRAPCPVVVIRCADYPAIGMALWKSSR